MPACTPKKRQSLLNDVFESPAVPYKTVKRNRSPPKSSPREFCLKTSRIRFDYGPPELNLYINVAKRANTLWKKAKDKFIFVTDDGEPLDGLFVIHGVGVNIFDHCLKIFDFDQEGEQHVEACYPSIEGRDIVCVIYIEEMFCKSHNMETAKTLAKVIEGVNKSNLFIMMGFNIDMKSAVEFCKNYKICHLSHIISPDSDKQDFYKAFYNILKRNLNTFSSDLEKRTQTRNVHAIKYELDFLVEKLRSRREKAKHNSPKQWLERLRAHIADNNGIVGYRLIGEDLYIFESKRLLPEGKQEKRKLIEMSINTSFKGKIHFRPFSDVFNPHSVIRCGDYLLNKEKGFMGTIGMFGSLKYSGEKVAISSPHVISAGTVACLPDGMRFGECIWPESPENIHDISLIMIDTSSLDLLQTSILKTRIKIQENSRDDLTDRRVIKYGAATKKTVGWIEKIDDFEICGSDVLVIIPEDVQFPFSTNGDSGAIVLTKMYGEYHGIAMVYGGEFDIRNSENKSIQKETIAIFLKNALDRFVKDRKMAIVFDEI